MECLKTVIGWLSTAVIVLLLAAGCSPAAGENPIDPEGPFSLIMEDLPFPADQVARCWDVDETRVLIEQIDRLDYYYYLYDSETGGLDVIAGASDSAVFEYMESQAIYFIARGGGDAGYMEFPYRLCYDLATAEWKKEELQLPLSEPAAFGKDSWKQVLRGLYVEGPCLVLEFVPHKETVLAGAQNNPLTTVNYLDQPVALVLRFYSVAVGDIPQSIEPFEENSLFKRVSVQEKPVSLFLDDDLPLLQGNHTYGLLLPQDKMLEGAGVEVRIELTGGEFYSIRTAAGEEEGVSFIRYYLECRL